MRGQQAAPQLGMRPQLIADTTILNHMELTPDQLQQVAALNDSYVENFKQAMQQYRPEKGARVAPEQRDAMQQQIQDARVQARQQLRTILGDEKYIKYLEQSIENLQRNPGMMRGGARGPQLKR